MLKAQRSLMQSYAVAFVAVGFALLAMLLLDPWLAMSKTPFLLFLGGVMVSAWYGGRGAGLLATCLSVLLSNYFFVEPTFAIALDSANIAPMTLFVGEGALISILWEALPTKHRLAATPASSQSNEERFRLALSSSDIVAFQQDRELKYLWIHNPQSVVTTAEVLGKTDYELFSHSEAERLTAIKRQVLESGIPTRQEVYLTVNGEVCYYDLMVEPLRQADKEIIGIACAALNVTSRKQTEENARQLAAQVQDQANTLNAILATSVDHIYVIDRTGRYRYVSDGGASVLGYKPSEIIGKTWQELGLNPDIMKRVDAQLQAVISTGEPCKSESDYLGADGIHHYYEYIITPLRNQAQEIEAVVAVSRDITDRKLAEKAIATSESKFRRLVEASIFGVAITHFDGRIIYANDALLNMVGYTREEILAGSMRWDQMTPPEYLHLDKRGVEELRQHGVATPFEKEYIRKDGSRVPILIGGAFLEEPYDRQEEIIAFFLDMTEIKRNEALLATQNQVLEAIAKGLPLSEVLSLLVRSIEKQSNGGTCSVFLRSADGSRLADLVAPNLPETYRQAIKEGIAIGEGLGSCGTAAYRKESVIVSEIASDPLWAEWKHLPLSHGLQACWSTPIVGSDGEVLGTFGMYYRTPSTPNPQDRRLVELSTHLAGIAIERQRAFSALKASEERLRLALEAGKMGIWDWNILTGEVKWSDNLEEIYGIEKGSVGGTFADFHSIVHPEDWEMVQRAIAQAVETKSAYDIEFRIVCADGSTRWIAGKGQTYCDDEGKAVRTIGVGMDMSDRKRTEVALRQINERFELATSAVKCLVYEWDALSGQLDRTQGLLDIVGYRPEEAEPTKDWWNERIHPEDSPRLSDKVAKALAEDDSFTLEYRVRHKNGQYRYLWDRALVERNSQGQLVRVIGCSLDVTDRKRIEEAQRYLAEASRVLSGSLDYQTTLKSVAELTVPHLADWCTVHIVEEDGGVQQLATAHVNPEKVKWAEEINRRYPFDPDDPRGIANVLRTGESELYPQIPDALLVESARDREHLQILREVGFSSVMIVPMLARGRSLGAISFVGAESGRVYDRQDLALAEELAHRAALAVDNARLYQTAQRDRAIAVSEATRSAAANRSKDEFLATLSHELRTPLNAILGWTQMLRTRQLDRGTTAKALETMYRNIKSLSAIVEDLLDVSRIITGKLPLNISSVEPIPVIEAAIEAVRPAAEAKEIQLHFLPGCANTSVLADANRLQQIVWNLVSNAVKFTPNGGRVEISCDCQDSQIQIKVTDTGIGISRDFLPYVFDRFTQADSSTTRKYGGLGLGLAIVRHLVELQGGTVAVESLGLGQGTTFTVTLPITTAHFQPNQGEAQEEMSTIDFLRSS